MDIDRKQCVIDNVNVGFDIYEIDTGDFVRALEVGKPFKTFGKGVAFANGNNAVIGGSDHGMVYIFDRESGTILKKIRHSKTGGVETIAVRNFFLSLDSEHRWLTPIHLLLLQVYDADGGSVLIATASVSDVFGSSCPIYLWRWVPAKKRGKSRSSRWSIWDAMQWTCQILVACAAMAYMYEIWKVCRKYY